MYGNETELKGYMPLLFVIVLATFMDGIDGVVASVVLPDIATHFSISTGSSALVVTVYSMMLAGLILVFGKICDRGAIRMVLLGGLIVLSTGALLCSISQWFPMLIVSRAIKGTGAAMLACSVVMLGVKYLPRNLTPYVLVAATTGESLGSVFGPLYSGLVVDYLSWEWVFFINVPLGLICYVVARNKIPRDEFKGMGDFDYRGAILLFAATVSLFQFIERASSEGFTILTWLMMSVFVVSLILLILYNPRAKDPIINGSLFKNRGMKTSMLAYVLVVMCGMGVVYILPFYMTKMLGFSVTVNGIYFFVSGLVTLLTCVKAASWIVRYGTRPFSILCCVIALVMSLCLAVIQFSPIPLLISALVLLGLLWGFADATLGTRIINTAPSEDRLSCSATCTFIGYFSVVAGAAAYSALFNIGSGDAAESFATLGADMFMDGYACAVVSGVLMSVVALILIWIVKRDFNGSSNDDPM